MKAGVIIVCLVLLIIGTGFYMGIQVASYTGNVVSDAYQVFDSVDTGAGTLARIVSVVGGEEGVRVTLALEDTALHEHMIDLTLSLFSEEQILGRIQETVLVPYNDTKVVVLLVPVSVFSDSDVTLRVEGTDDLGMLRIEGITRLAVHASSQPFLWWGFGGFLVLLSIIFLIVRHSLTRAKVARFAQAHSDGLIRLR